MIRLAVFADIHGKFLLPFKLVQHYQNITGEKIDFMLQCGDMGAVPDKTRMDKATLRHMQHDHDAQGFIDNFVTPKAAVKALLDSLNINKLCVHGNHEDHDFLDKLEQVHALYLPLTSERTHFPQAACFSLDAYQRVCVVAEYCWYLKKRTENGTEWLTVIGIGRIGDRKSRTDGQFI